MRVKIINLILLIASWLPVFSLTEDEKYGELKIDNSIAVRSQLRTWRLSLFQIMLGAYKFYILTLSRTYDNNTNKVLYHPKLFKLISLKKIFDKNDHHIEQIYNDYYMRLNNSKMTEDRLEKEKESLCYHIEVENSRLEKSDNKMNIYTTVLLTALPILLGISFDSILLLFKTNMIYKAFFIISAYFVMNIVLYLFQYIGSLRNVGVVKSICKQVQTAAYQCSNHGISATGGFISHGYSFFRNRVSFVN